MQTARRTVLLTVTAILALLMSACAETAEAPLPTLAATTGWVLLGGEDATAAATAALTTPVPEATQAPVVAGTQPPAPTELPATATLTPEPTATPTPEPAAPITYTYRVLNVFPHDTGAWTQGLVMDQGVLYEGTGEWGRSSLREVALETGQIIRAVPLEDQYYGEGITVFGDQIYQLTWQDGAGFIYDKNSFQLLDLFNYDHEGWGITHDGQRLIVSDGTATIRFWDPATLEETGQVLVHDNRGPVNRLNELEYINGEIFAHVWLTDLIARISPETGEVTGWVDLTGLLDTSSLTEPVNVLNGLAYDTASGRLFVTGKLWPSLFEIELIPVE